MVIDLTAIESWRAALLRSLFFKIIDAGTNVGRNTDNRGFFLDIKTPEVLMGTMHDVERKLSIAKALGANVNNTDIGFKIYQEDRKFVENWLEENGISRNDTLIGLNPGSYMPNRRWS